MDEGPIELVPEPTGPDLPGVVVFRPSADDVLDALATDLYFQALGCSRQFGDFHLAVRHGPMVEKLCVRLMTDPRFRELPWRRTHLWLVSEGPLGPDHPGAAARHLRELLVGPADLPGDQVHPLPAHRPDGDHAYERELMRVLSSRERGHDRLDAAVLELDPDGSIGHCDDAAHEEPGSRLVLRSNDTGPTAMTTALVRTARLIAILAIGAEVARAVDAIAADPAGSSVGRLTPLAGERRWYVDGPAAGHPAPDDDDRYAHPRGSTA